jgi:uroporphyrin-3 C-methyltransferase
LSGQREDDARPRAPEEATGGLARLRAKIADFFGSIFRVRRTEGSEAPLLAPEESFFLRRNLELELQAARVALLEGDPSVYRASLNSARRWTEEYFRMDDAGVKAFVTALGELEGRRIEVEIPDISGSLEALLASGAGETR